MDERPDAISRIARDPVSRRRALQVFAAGGTAAFLAACGTAALRTPTPGATGTRPPATGTPGTTGTPAPGTTGTPGTPEPTPGDEPTAPATRPPATGMFRWANWVGYIDRQRGPRYPTLERFTQETGIQVEYEQAINDNESFFTADLEGPLSVGQPTGWDLVVLTDWMMQRLVTLGWLEEIDTSWMTNYPANLADVYVGRAWDPENRLAAPWQGGMTGIAHDRARTGEITSLEAFWDPQYAGQMSYLTEMRDTVGLAALRLGLDPNALTQEQFDQALAEVRRATDEGIVRQFYGNEYVDAMDRGDVIIAMGWSGDVLGLLVPDQDRDQDFHWVLPEEGGLIWTDNMGIPKGAVNKISAEYWIDFYYQPEIAAIVEAWVNYVCPVKGAREEMLELDPDLAENTLIFPTDEMTARLYDFVALDLDTEQQWQAAFDDARGL